MNSRPTGRGFAPVVPVIVVAAFCCASCAPALVPLAKLPLGPGTPVTGDQSAVAFAQATEHCAALRAVTLELAVRGVVGQQRVRGRLAAGIVREASEGSHSSVRLEAVAPFGPPLFIFVGTGDEASLLLPRDNRVLRRGAPEAVLEAVAGVPLGVTDLDALLTGCGPGTGPALARSPAPDWLVLAMSDADLYLHREGASAPWRLVAVERRGPGHALLWRADFSSLQDGMPRVIRLASAVTKTANAVNGAGGHAGTAFDLQLTLSQVDARAALDADAFKIQIPASAMPITLEELRRGSPLANPSQSASDGR